jgi:diacylglycerol kinase (ATP)
MPIDYNDHLSAIRCKHSVLVRTVLGFRELRSLSEFYLGSAKILTRKASLCPVCLRGEFLLRSAPKMRAAAILGLGTSTRHLEPFQQGSPVEWMVGLPSVSENLDAILVLGGDGTVHRHLGALVKLARPVLVVPVGSGNDFARTLGLLRGADSLAAWRKFVSNDGNVREVDLGLITPVMRSADSRREGLVEPSLCRASSGQKPTYFSCAAGVGLDGEIARRANALPRWMRARGGYALSLPPALLSFRPFNLTLSVQQGEPREFCLRSQQPVVAAVFANTPFYGGGMRVAPRAQLDDGRLDVCVIRDISKVKLLTVFPSVYFGRHLGIREVDYFPAVRILAETDRVLDVYADGEQVGRTPVEISVAPKALRVVIP